MVSVYDNVKNVDVLFLKFKNFISFYYIDYIMLCVKGVLDVY